MPSLDMEKLALEMKILGSDVYHALGLKESKRVLGAPRVLSLLSSILERSVQKNEKLLETKQIKDVVTLFQGSRAPTLSIRHYIDRIFKYSGCSPSCFVVAHIYVDRYLHRTDVHLTSLNVHRLLITSVMIAAKFVDDAFFNNAYYAKVGGLSTVELNRLEMKFLFSLDFRLQVSVETFGKYCSQIEKEATSGLQIEWPIQTCRRKESWSSKDDSACAPTIAR
ncbi:cyclin-U3-1 isoform X2 [Malania oleifera]|uniref:cyclin-U3-1 isoform X2 n=1 Tax=Malania oleifera TaxID=397392 RepID=UPI0025AE0AF2|nr:cyclin-U3-1 isoform X2 [Malania oleifera]